MLIRLAGIACESDTSFYFYSNQINVMNLQISNLKSNFKYCNEE